MSITGIEMTIDSGEKEDARLRESVLMEWNKNGNFRTEILLFGPN